MSKCKDIIKAVRCYLDGYDITHWRAGVEYETADANRFKGLNDHHYSYQKIEHTGNAVLVITINLRKAVAK